MNLNRILSILALLICSFFIGIIYLKARTPKIKIITSILLGSIFAILAYNFIPEDNYDLVRHHDMAKVMANAESTEDFFNLTRNNDLEILPLTYSMIIGKIGDYNLMQAIIVLIGYSLLFYLLLDYRNTKRLPAIKFIPLLLVTIFGQHILFYFSGLYNYFAINLFAFALYLDYVKRKKYWPYILYGVALLMHNSILLPAAALLITKVKKGNISKRFSIILLSVLLLSNVLLSIVVDMLNIDFLTNIKMTYDSYVAHNDKMIGLYDGFYLFMSITKILIALFACWICRKEESNKNSRNYTLLLSIIVIALSFSSIAITRFSSLILFTSIPVIVDAIKDNSGPSRLLMALIVLLAVTYTFYSLQTIMPMIYLG